MPQLSAAILLSRQPLRPSNQTSWVKKCTETFTWLKNRNVSVLSSVGMQTWEMVLFLASFYTISQKIVVPATDEISVKNISDFLLDQFNLNPELVEFIPIFGDSKTFKLKRDLFILKNAKILIPVSVRKNGTFDSFLQNTQSTVINNFQTEYVKKELQPKKYTFLENTLCENPLLFTDKYLFHWTRSCNTCWPHEKLYDYYLSVLNSENFPNDAFNTLLNIFRTKHIFASSRHMPQKTECVSFTAKPPFEFLNLMNWRARYSEMAFEPYGIGIKKSYAESAGIKEVVYCEKIPKCEPDKKWLYQTRGKISNWQKEIEFRYKGDFSLEDIPPEYLVSVCRYSHEAALVEKKYGIRTIYLFEK